MSDPIALTVHGAAGRMGRRVVALADEDARFRLVGAMERSDHELAGTDCGVAAGIGELGVNITAEAPSETQVVVDFSLPEALDAVVASCVARGLPLVIATTGLSQATEAAIQKAKSSIPVLWAPSMSLAVNLVMKLTEIAGSALKCHAGGVDVEVIERHHRFKEDAPSGTALRFGSILSDAMELTAATHGRSGRPGARPRDEIGYHAVRVGDNPGEHQIIFGMLGETIELGVKASNRDCYAAGALEAAAFLVEQPAGLYSMNDVLRL